MSKSKNKNNQENSVTEENNRDFLSDEISLSKEDQKKVLDGLLKAQHMLKEIIKQHYLNDQNPITIVWEENEKLLDELK